jgi:hypothetical protein
MLCGVWRLHRDDDPVLQECEGCKAVMETDGTCHHLDTVEEIEKRKKKGDDDKDKDDKDKEDKEDKEDTKDTDQACKITPSPDHDPAAALTTFNGTNNRLGVAR